jgi:SpoVK/Ycf46/Vps4 family AAA+-type ATPase
MKFVQWLDTFREREISPEDLEKLYQGIEEQYTKHFLTVQTPESDLVLSSSSSSSASSSSSSLSCLTPQSRHIILPTTRLQTVEDILTLITNYPVEPNTTYNVDLQMLHIIAPELKELSEMVGLKEFKTSMTDQILYFMQELHLAPHSGGEYKHTVFMGPPGTGKTELARLMGKIYGKMGVFQTTATTCQETDVKPFTTGQETDVKPFKKVVRSDLVAGYVGQTALKTLAILKECLGGVLFIDEAYSLALNDVFSQECIDTLCEFLSDHKNNLMVIVAGYEDQMKNIFFKANPGLESRFLWRFTTPGYSAMEMKKIFEKKVHDAEWTISEISVTWFERNMSYFPHFGRDMEMLFIYSKIAHSRRIYGDVYAQKKQITQEDVNSGFATFRANSFHDGGMSVSRSMMYT